MLRIDPLLPLLFLSSDEEDTHFHEDTFLSVRIADSGVRPDCERHHTSCSCGTLGRNEGKDRILFCRGYARRGEGISKKRVWRDGN